MLEEVGRQGLEGECVYDRQSRTQMNDHGEAKFGVRQVMPPVINALCFGDRRRKMQDIPAKPLICMIHEVSAGFIVATSTWQLTKGKHEKGVV